MNETIYSKIINDLTLQIANLTLEKANQKAIYESEIERLTAELDEATAPTEKGEAE